VAYTRPPQPQRHVAPTRSSAPSAYRDHALGAISRSRSEPAEHVTRAKALLEVASGASFSEAARARILAEFRRAPDREADGTAVWSLVTLQRALRRAPDGLPAISTHTVLKVLHGAGYTWQRDRTWCPTGTAQRKRETGVVTVVDLDAAPRKS
jgi:hypothetical protein